MVVAKRLTRGRPGQIVALVWVAALATFVLVEKVVPGGRWISRVAGGLFVVAGVWLLIPH